MIMISDSWILLAVQTREQIIFPVWKTVNLEVFQSKTMHSSPTHKLLLPSGSIKQPMLEKNTFLNEWGSLPPTNSYSAPVVKVWQSLTGQTEIKHGCEFVPDWDEGPESLPKHCSCSPASNAAQLSHWLLPRWQLQWDSCLKRCWVRY